MNITLTKDTITPELQRLIAAAKRPRPIFQAGAKSLQVEISRHLRVLQARGNVKGWPPQKFFAGKPTSVERHVGVSGVTDRGAVVTIADPRFVHRVKGGTVTAKRAKYLAIPLTAEAYAKAGKGSILESMPGLAVIKFARGLFLCRKGKDSLVPLFKLQKAVTHRPHPEEMPDEQKLLAAAETGMTRAAKLLFGAQ